VMAWTANSSRKRRREARNGETARGEGNVDSEFQQLRGVRLLQWWWWLLLGALGELWERQQR
jgi:hypothetical protein